MNHMELVSGVFAFVGKHAVAGMLNNAQSVEFVY